MAKKTRKFAEGGGSLDGVKESQENAFNPNSAFGKIIARGQAQQVNSPFNPNSAFGKIIARGRAQQVNTPRMGMMGALEMAADIARRAGENSTQVNSPFSPNSAFGKIIAEGRAQQGMKKGGKVKKMAKGGSTASKRADGCATKGRTKGKFI